MPSPTPFIRAVLTIIRRDLQAESRNRQLITSMAMFAVLCTVIFYFTLESRPDVRLAALPSVVWVIVVFTSTLGISRSLAQEHDRGILDALLLAPIDRAVLFYGKLVTTWLYSLVVGALVTLALGFLFTLGFPLAWWLIVVLGTLGLAAVGTLLGSMAIHSQGRETTLPIIVLPIALPILMASVYASNLILANRPFEDWATWPALLVVTDIVFVTIPLLLFDFIVEE